MEDWSLAPMDLWAVYPSGRKASAKARAFVAFVEAMLACHEPVALNPIYGPAGRRQPDAEPLRHPAHRRRAVLAQEVEQAHLAKGQLLSYPFGNLRALVIPKAAECLDGSLYLELAGRYFAHSRIV